MNLLNLMENFLNLTILNSRKFVFLLEKILKISLNDNINLISEKSEIVEIKQPAVEKATFELYLLEKIIDQSNKIKAIKLIREIVGLELRLAKELIDKAPVTIKKDLTKSEAEELLKKCSTVEAKFEIR